MNRRLLAVAVACLTATGAFAGSTTIHLTAPHVDSWTLSSGGNTYVLSAGNLTSLQSGLNSAFGSIEADLNANVFSQLHDLTKLAKGFANANAAAFDNASLMGYQTYDLFGLTIGLNLGAAVPTLDPLGATQALDNLTTTGDAYAGLGTGGVAGQLGVNLGALVPGLYASIKAGSVPSLEYQGTSFQQSMFGLGVNYTLVPQYDFLSGLLKWRGVSAGTGLVFNSSSTNVTIGVDDKSSSAIVVTLDGPSSTQFPVNVTPRATNTKAKLSVDNSSVVIPLDVMTSVQALWFFNVGLGLGLDVAFSQAQVKMAAQSDLVLDGADGAVIVPGTVVLNSSSSQNGGDLFLPRIAASVGVDLTIFKLDVPMSYYPLSNAFAFGVTGGIVW